MVNDVNNSMHGQNSQSNHRRCYTMLRVNSCTYMYIMYYNIMQQHNAFYSRCNDHTTILFLSMNTTRKYA